MMHFSYTLSDGQLGLMVVVILPALGAFICLYNAYRMGRLKWKPKGRANPRLVSLVTLAGILLAGALLAAVE